MSTREQLTEEHGGWGAFDDLPGNPMIWVLIICELMVFGAFFGGFCIARYLHVDMFNASQAHLDRLLGGLNTIVLISSGYLAALAVKIHAEGRESLARWTLVASMGVGSLFIVIKLIEYSAKFDQGIGLETNTFWTLYFLITGFHFLHVIFGIIILAIVAWKNSLTNLETGTAFWHMVDLIWILIYPLIYLIR